MRGETLPPASILRPILDQYRGAAVSIIGCHAIGLERPSCELDVVLVSNERQVANSLRLKGQYVDILFLSERDLLRPRSPEMAMTLARVRAVRDQSLIVSTSSAANAAVFEVNAKKSAQGRLASSVKALGRADEALGKQATIDADYWLLRASYDYGYAWLFTKQVVPAPSHLVHQLKRESKGSSKNFEAFSKGAGLERASRAATVSRLEGIGVLQDFLRSRRHGSGAAANLWSETRFKIAKRKADYLTESIDHVECHSFLGIETLVALRAIVGSVGGNEGSSEPMVISRLADNKEGIIGARLLGDLGLTRPQKTVETALRALKEQVSQLARRL